MMIPDAHDESSAQAGGADPAISTVLVIDDSPLDRELIGRLLDALPDVRVAYARNGAEGRAAIKAGPPRVILTDLVLPDVEGTELIRDVRADYPHIPMILVTAYGSEQAAMQALRAARPITFPRETWRATWCRHSGRS